MKETTVAAFLIGVAILIIAVMSSAFIVSETEQAIVTRFGEPIRQPITAPGLHWKLPLVEVIHKFDKRILEWDGDPSQIPTRDKKFIWVDLTGRWRIKDPLLFFKTMHNERTAQTRLDDIMEGIARNYITQHNLVAIVRSTNNILTAQQEDGEDAISGDSQVSEIKVGRNAITRQIRESARGVLQEYGIELVDLQIKRINYVQSVQQKVFERMISERKRAAEELRSEGQGVRAEVEGQKEKELKRIQSEAYRKTQKIRGEADAEATQIYGEAYSKDPKFYAFIRTIEKYPDALKGGRLVLTTQSDFLKYLKDAK